MAARYQKLKQQESETPETRIMSIIELEKEQITREVAEEKQKLKTTFQHLHRILVQKEEKLIAELDAITADILVKVEERRESLEKLNQQKEETEKKLQANVLNDILEQQLSDIQNQIDKILSEQILIPRVYLSCHMKNIQKILEDNYHIIKTPNPYIFRTLPLWNEGKGGNLLSHYSNAICIDKNSQLVYVGDANSGCKIQVFSIEGEHRSTLFNKSIGYIDSMQTQGEYIYASSHGDLYKLNTEGDTIKILKFRFLPIYSLSIEDMKLYTCSFDSSTVTVYDLNLKYIKSITLQPISFDENTAPQDILLNKQQIFILFRHFNLKMHHPDPIQIFQLDGTLIRSIVTGSNIKYSKYFCLDSYENILVSDYEGNCIRIFSPEGILMQSIGGDGELENPRGISVDLKGRIIILNDKGGAKLRAF